MKSLIFLFSLTPLFANATVGIVCDNIEAQEPSVIEYLDCEDNLCALKISAPFIQNNLPFSAFTLFIGTRPNPTFSAILKHKTEKNGRVSVEIFGAPEKLTQFKIQTLYFESGECGVTTVVDINKEHNKSINVKAQQAVPDERTARPL